jgi:cell division protein FtsB
MSGEQGGMEVGIDLADLVEVLREDNARLQMENAMLRAAVRKLRRELDQTRPSEADEVASAGLD